MSNECLFHEGFLFPYLLIYSRSYQPLKVRITISFILEYPFLLLH